MRHPIPSTLLLSVALLAGPAGLFTRAQTHEEEERLRAEEEAYLRRQLPPTAEAAPLAPPLAPPGAEAIATFIEEADRLVRDRHYRVGTSAHYEVKTDDPRLSAPAMAGLLESFRSFFDEFWSGRMELRPYEDTGRVYLFYSFYKYNQLLTGRKEFGTFRPTGHYRPFVDVAVIYSDNVAPGDLPEVLVHEAAHQLVEQRIYESQAPRAPWLSEGLASYFGYTLREANGTFREGLIGGKSLSILEGGSKPHDGSANDRLKEMRRTLKRDRRFSAAELTHLNDPSIFYGDGVEERYAASWLLVHFLFHGEEGAHAAAFLRYLGEERRGQAGGERLLAELTLSGDELDRRFRDHVHGLKAGAPSRSR